MNFKDCWLNEHCFVCDEGFEQAICTWSNCTIDLEKSIYCWKRGENWAVMIVIAASNRGCTKCCETFIRGDKREREGR